MSSPSRQPEKKENVSWKSVRKWLKSSTWTLMLNWASATSKALSTTHSFCRGDREHVEYTSSAPGFAARIPALQGRGTHKGTGSGLRQGQGHSHPPQTPLNSIVSAVCVTAT